MRLRKEIALTVLAIFLVGDSCFAQQTPTKNVKRAVATVLFSTLGGAILGLSTLPFYGEPQEHTDNISVGALLGLIGGSGYIIYSASQPNSIQNKYEYSQQETQEKQRALAMNTRAPLLKVYIEF